MVRDVNLLVMMNVLHFLWKMYAYLLSETKENQSDGILLQAANGMHAHRRVFMADVVPLSVNGSERDAAVLSLSEPPLRRVRTSAVTLDILTILF